jgi:p-aminobenzoyl-glutamate transporter AbgT
MGTPAALFTMKGKLVTYWIATIVICAFMSFVAFSYLSRDEKMMSGFASLGYPSYFPMILGVAKSLGVLALLVPGLPRLKEWAYAGFTFTFLGAIWSHLAADQSKAALMPLASLVVLAVSYACRPAERRVPAESEADVHHHVGGLPIR